MGLPNEKLMIQAILCGLSETELFQLGVAFVARLLSLEMGDRLLDVASVSRSRLYSLVVVVRPFILFFDLALI